MKAVPNNIINFPANPIKTRTIDVYVKAMHFVVHVNSSDGVPSNKKVNGDIELSYGIRKLSPLKYEIQMAVAINTISLDNKPTHSVSTICGGFFEIYEANETESIKLLLTRCADEVFGTIECAVYFCTKVTGLPLQLQKFDSEKFYIDYLANPNRFYEFF